jgi:hypothetical protein
MIKNSIGICVLVLLKTAGLYAQTFEENYERKKLALNFENVQRQGTQISYENRLYRNPLTGMLEMRKVAGDTAVLTLVPLFQGFPVGAYTLGRKPGYAALSAAGQKAVVGDKSFPLHLKNYKLDVWIQPYFAAMFGNFNRPVESNTSVALQTQLFLWPGFSVSTGILFPIINQMDGRPRNVRPAPTYVNQFYNRGKHFISASAGFFHNDQYGVNVQYRHTDLSKPFSFGLEAGMTGLYYYPRGGIYYESPDNLLLLADVAYRFRTSDFTVKLSGGQFMWAVKGARLDLIRQFHNVEIGFYATATENGSTLGFNFAVPIPPGKILQGKNVRLRTTDEFRWEYTYTRGYKIGERYRVGYQLDQKLRQYHVDYLGRQLERAREK